jgi:hypothetical protein
MDIRLYDELISHIIDLRERCSELEQLLARTTGRVQELEWWRDELEADHEEAEATTQPADVPLEVNNIVDSK